MTDKPYTVTDEARQSILAQKITVWQNTAYDAALDAKVAQALEDTDGEAQAKARLKKCLQAIEVLQAEV
jgi:hypothetical protein